MPHRHAGHLFKMKISCCCLLAGQCRTNSSQLTILLLCPSLLQLLPSLEAGALSRFSAGPCSVRTSIWLLHTAGSAGPGGRATVQQCD